MLRRHLLHIIALMLFAAPAFGQYSYIYIQGDKQTPFYVKLEGEMQPRYGKNYYIIPKLETGLVNIDILFQQNAYPAQHFKIKVPEGGSRGFIITHKGDAFSLYDLKQQFYLPSGNSEDDDRLPANKPAVAVATPVTPVSQPTKPVIVAKAEKPKPVKQKTYKAPPPPTPAKKADDGKPNFMDDIELSNEHTASPSVPAPVKEQRMEEEKPDNKQEETQLELANSDCPQAMSNDSFEDLYKKTMAKPSEEARLVFLNNQLDNCFTTQQASYLAKTLDSDAARFTFLKKLYPRVTNQGAFASLEQLFSNEQWKAHFRQLTQH